MQTRYVSPGIPFWIHPEAEGRDVFLQTPGFIQTNPATTLEKALGLRQPQMQPC